jgi:hypothetical protein
MWQDANQYTKVMKCGHCTTTQYPVKGKPYKSYNDDVEFNATDVTRVDWDCPACKHTLVTLIECGSDVLKTINRHVKGSGS